MPVLPVEGGLRFSALLDTFVKHLVVIVRDELSLRSRNAVVVLQSGHGFLQHGNVTSVWCFLHGECGGHLFTILPAEHQPISISLIRMRTPLLLLFLPGVCCLRNGPCT